MIELMRNLILKRHKKLLLRLPISKAMLSLIIQNQVKTRNFKDLKLIWKILGLQNNLYFPGMIREMDGNELSALLGSQKLCHHERRKFYFSEGFINGTVKDPCDFVQSSLSETRLSMDVNNPDHAKDTKPSTTSGSKNNTVQTSTTYSDVILPNTSPTTLKMQYHLSRFNYTLALDCLALEKNLENLRIFYTFFILNSCSSLPRDKKLVYQIDYGEDLEKTFGRERLLKVFWKDDDGSDTNNPDILKDPYTNTVNPDIPKYPSTYTFKTTTTPLLYQPPQLRLSHSPSNAISIFIHLLTNLFPQNEIYKVIGRVHCERGDVEVVEEILEEIERGDVVEMYRRLGMDDKADLLEFE